MEKLKKGDMNPQEDEPGLIERKFNYAKVKELIVPGYMQTPSR